MYEINNYESLFLCALIYYSVNFLVICTLLIYIYSIE